MKLRKGRAKYPKRDKEKARRIHRLLGRAANEKGRNREHQLLDALTKTGPLPYWIYAVRPATAKEDMEGKDVLVLTDVGMIPLQVKSSRSGVRYFRQQAQKHQEDIATIVIRADDTLHSVCTRAVIALQEKRAMWIKHHWSQSSSSDEAGL